MAAAQRVVADLAVSLAEKTRQEGDCVVWTASKNRYGYGQLSWRGKHWEAHRAAWFALTGEKAPRGIGVLHRCDNPACIRIDHLFLGTQAANMADKVAKGRQCRGERRSEMMRKIWAERRLMAASCQ
jgi:hypothetical protein